MRDWPWYSYIVLAALIFGLFYFFYFKPQNEELLTHLFMAYVRMGYYQKQRDAATQLYKIR